MRLKKILYILVCLVLLLTACGKANEKKEPEKVSETEIMKEEETSQDESKEPSDNTENSESSKEKLGQKTENSKPSNNASQTSETTTNSSNQKPAQNSNNAGSNTTQNSNNSNQNSNTTSQKPSNTTNQNSNQGTTQTSAKKPVKRVSEEVKSDVVPYKYGVTKYDVTTNYYTLYSDGSKELLDSESYPVYDSSNYSATDSQLKSEADSNASKYMGYYQEVLRLVNEIRASAGVGPLTLDTTLCKAASMRALEMDYRNQMSHTRPSGKDCFSVLDFYGISFGTCGENIAAGQTSAASVVKGWKNSPSHYQNMINASYTKLGVGYSASGVGDYGYYWCQLFTN
ncbi:MAG: hypothetical protein IJA19_05845 [Clostridia bacterium]|nr:hypothetical protein [Clostridia bacterium]